MAKLSALTRHLNSTCAFSAITNKTTGPTYFRSRSSPTIMHLVPPLGSRLSSPTKATIQTSRYTPNAISPPTVPATASPTSTNFTKHLKPPSLRHKSITKPPPISDELRHLTFKLVNKSSSKPSSSAPPIPLRSCPRSSSAPSPSLPVPAHTPSHSDFPTPCEAYTLCTMSPCLNPPPPTKFRIGLSHLRPRLKLKAKLSMK